MRRIHGGLLEPQPACTFRCPDTAYGVKGAGTLSRPGNSAIQHENEKQARNGAEGDPRRLRAIGPTGSASRTCRQVFFHLRFL
jgi:hypothetical protein